MENKEKDNSIAWYYQPKTAAIVMFIATVILLVIVSILSVVFLIANTKDANTFLQSTFFLTNIFFTMVVAMFSYFTFDMVSKSRFELNKNKQENLKANKKKDSEDKMAQEDHHLWLAEHIKPISTENDNPTQEYLDKKFDEWIVKFKD